MEVKRYGTKMDLQYKPKSPIFYISLGEIKDKGHMDQKTFWSLFTTLMVILIVEVYLINSKIKQYLDQ